MCISFSELKTNTQFAAATIQTGVIVWGVTATANPTCWYGRLLLKPASLDLQLPVSTLRWNWLGVVHHD